MDTFGGVLDTVEGVPNTVKSVVNEVVPKRFNFARAAGHLGLGRLNEHLIRHAQAKRKPLERFYELSNERQSHNPALTV